MQLQRFTDPGLFRAAVWEFLYAEEGLNTVALGVIDQLLETPPRYDRFFLAAVRDRGRLVATALMTPPHPFNIFCTDRAAIGSLVEFAMAIDRPRSVLGANGLAFDFAREWRQRTPAGIEDVEEQGIFEANAVIWPAPCKGSMRLATAADLSDVSRCFHGFAAEVDQPDSIEAARLQAERRIGMNSVYVWQEADTICGTAVVSRQTPTGACISYVYTDKRRRGKGIASNLVASLCDKLLTDGKKRLFLYTQLKNPTSNKIYQAIGFRKIADSARIAFRYD